MTYDEWYSYRNKVAIISGMVVRFSYPALVSSIYKIHYETDDRLSIIEFHERTIEMS